MSYKITTVIEQIYELGGARIYRDAAYFLGRADVVLALQEDGHIQLALSWTQGPLEDLAGEMQLQVRGERNGARVLMAAEGFMPSVGKMKARKYRIGGDHA